MVADHGGQRPETQSPRLSHGPEMPEKRASDEVGNPRQTRPRRRGLMIMIRMDESSWRMGFEDGKEGKHSPDKSEDKLSYESGHIEGMASVGEEDHDTEGPK